MRVSLLSVILLVPSALSIELSPFYPPLDNTGVGKRSIEDVLRILKRHDNNCPAGYDPCSDLGNSEVCCRDGTRCSRDAANNIACCPTGASCTGSLTPTTGPGAQSTGFMFPQSTSASTTESNAAAITGSTVPNAPYPFVYIPTTFANAKTCSSYYSECQTQYSKCAVSLGGVHGVTVAGPGGGITVQGSTPTGDAQSICSSLSREACYGLQVGYCTAFGTAGATGNQFVNPGQAAPRRSSSFRDLAVGLAVGVAGLFV
ncbi:hypothetical protein VTN00DRAFT_440 [Thermoascus crustaceus]|uniref:uncharacterized protein n=1 Tax=Thermoascus crustaceus TaxID=5088 RepID=UPI00374382C1